VARISLVAEVSDGILRQIIDGSLPIGSGLPSEADVSAAHDVSRMTVREAIKTLQAQGIVRIENGRGSFVNPVSSWNSLDAVLKFASVGSDEEQVALELIEVRRLFETGAAALAAQRRSAEDLAAISEHLDDMRAAHGDGALARFVEADLAFHARIIEASRNVFLGVMLAPLTRILAQKREETSRIPTIQEHAIREHGMILKALAAGDPEAARSAMDKHMDQTQSDLRAYVVR
jgi:DNA-binding FadR family transcriptional regulator